MDWLSKHNPMQVHWTQKWLQLDHDSKPIQLYGIQPTTIMGPPITTQQLYAMQKSESILYIIQLNPVEDTISDSSDSTTTTPTIPPTIQTIIS